MTPPSPEPRRRRWVAVAVAALAVATAWILGRARPAAAQPIPPSVSPLPLGMSALLPVPEDNRLTAAKIELGRRLFFDVRLSRDGSMSCATCHRPERAFADGNALAIGIEQRKGRRNAPSLVNCGYRKSLFWDGRAASLEAQALQPIENPLEMGHSVAAVVADLSEDRSYLRLFARAFGSREVTGARLARALASFERTIVAGDTPFDRYSAGDRSALSPPALRGLTLFETKARCRFCHEGPLFSDAKFHNTGVGWGAEPRDLGRYEQTGRDEDRGRFKTPGLRELVHTAPYMHDGSLASLEEVVEFYDRGGKPNPRLDRAVRPLGLTDREKSDLVEFLRSLGSRPSTN